MMFSLRKCIPLSFKVFRSLYTTINFSPEVDVALRKNKPVVALETTVITHGMPSPHNLDTALAVEEIIREQVGVAIQEYILSAWLDH